MELKLRRSRTERVTDIYCITMLLGFPLFPGFFGYGEITAAKFGFFAAATGLWLAALAAAQGLDRARSRTGWIHMPSGAQWAGLSFGAVLLVSWLCSPRRAQGLLGAGRYDGLVSQGLYLCIFLGVSAFGRPRRAHFRALAASLSLCGLVALLQLMGRNPLWLYPKGLGYFDSGLRYSGAYLGTIGNTNIYDAVLCLALPCFAALTVLGQGAEFLIPIVLNLPVVILAGGDGGHLALGLCALALVAMLGLRCRGRRCWAWPLLSCLVAAAALGLLWAWPGTTGTLYELHQALHGHLEDSYGSSRIRIWRACLALAMERPLLGGGPGSLAARLDIAFSRYVPATGVTLHSFVDNAHNVYLSTLTELGALGLLARLAWMGEVARRGLRRLREPMTAALLLGLLGYAVHAFFGLGLCLSEPLAWLAAGLVCSEKG